MNADFTPSRLDPQLVRSRNQPVQHEAAVYKSALVVVIEQNYAGIEVGDHEQTGGQGLEIEANRRRAGRQCHRLRETLESFFPCLQLIGAGGQFDLRGGVQDLVVDSDGGTGR